MLHKGVHVKNQIALQNFLFFLRFNRKVLKLKTFLRAIQIFKTFSVTFTCYSIKFKIFKMIFFIFLLIDSSFSRECKKANTLRDLRNIMQEKGLDGYIARWLRHLFVLITFKMIILSIFKYF